MKEFKWLRLTPFGLTLLFWVAAAACGGGAGTATPSPNASLNPSAISGTLTLFAYEDGFTPAYIEPFKKMYPNLNLRASAYDSGDAAIAKLRAGFRADVINLCVDEDAAMAARLGLVQPLDVTRIKDWDKIFPAFKKLPGVTMPDGKHYMLPVDAGVTGMVYDPSKVSPAPTSFMELFNPKYAGHVTIIDYPVTAIQVGALALGYTDPAHLTDEQLANVEKLYIDAKKRGQFRTFYNNDSELVNLFKTGEIYFAVGGRGDTLNIKGEGVPVAFSLASNGQMLWTCGYGISSACQNVDAAYALLNYYLSPQAEGYEATKWNYMVANMDTLKAVTANVREAAGLAEPNNFGNVLPAAPPPEGYDKWIRAWQEVKRS